MSIETSILIVASCFLIPIILYIVLSSVQIVLTVVGCLVGILIYYMFQLHDFLFPVRYYYCLTEDYLYKWEKNKNWTYYDKHGKMIEGIDIEASDKEKFTRISKKKFNQRRMSWELLR